MIFTLHHVRPDQNLAFNPNAHLEVTPEFLGEAIETAKAAGMMPVSLEDLPALLANASDQRKFVCFTLDDGNRDNAQYAAPVFRKHGVPYTIFVAPGLAMRQRTMWWETIGELLGKTSSFSFDFGAGTQVINCASKTGKQDAFARFAHFVETTDEDAAVAKIDELARSLGVDPMDIVEREIMSPDELRELAKDRLVSYGGHTMTHCNLARVDDSRLSYELVQSSRLVSEYGGRPVTTFAYPYGGRNAASVRESLAAANAGIRVAVTTQPGVLSAESNLTALNRVSLNGLYQKRRYVRALISGLPFRLM